MPHLLLDIPRHGCRWPTGESEDEWSEGETLFCGSPSVTGRSYCAGHFRLAYVPRATKSASSERENAASLRRTFEAWTEAMAAE